MILIDGVRRRFVSVYSVWQQLTDTVDHMTCDLWWMHFVKDQAFVNYLVIKEGLSCWGITRRTMQHRLSNYTIDNYWILVTLDIGPWLNDIELVAINQWHRSMTQWHRPITQWLHGFKSKLNWTTHHSFTASFAITTAGKCMASSSNSQAVELLQWEGLDRIGRWPVCKQRSIWTCTWSGSGTEETKHLEVLLLVVTHTHIIMHFALRKSQQVSWLNC